MTANKPGRLSRSGFYLGIVAAALLIGGVHALSPMERQRVASYVDSKIERFDSVLKQVAIMRDFVGSTPFGEGRQDEQALAQRAADFGPKQRPYSVGSQVGSANALLLRHSELRRIKVGTAPDTVASNLSYEDHSVFEEIELSRGSYIDDMAGAAYERPFEGWIDESEARGMAARLDQLETVMIYRIGTVTRATLEAEKIGPGYMPADAFVFDLDSGDLISSFSFAATSSASLDPKFLQRDRDRDWKLRKDMSDNLEIVFWSQLKKRMPKAVFQHGVKDAPFTRQSLVQARTLAEQR